jgi:hypothetical protein
MTLRRRSFLALSGTVLAGAAGCLTTADDGSDSGVADDGDSDADGDTGGSGVETVEPDWVYDTGGVLALDAATCDREWVYGKTGGYSAYTPPVVVGDEMYAGSSGRVMALDL